MILDKQLLATITRSMLRMTYKYTLVIPHDNI